MILFVVFYLQSRSVGSVYPGYPPYGQQKVLSMPSPLQLQPSQYPVHPDVKFKKLPFFDMMGELLKPSSLTPQGTMRLQENTFVFHLTPQQANDISSSRDCRAGSKMDYIVQVCFFYLIKLVQCSST